MVLDALTKPVHRDGRPAHLSPDIDFYQGDTRNRDLLTNCFVASTPSSISLPTRTICPSSRDSPTSTWSQRPCFLPEIIVAEGLDLARVVVASSPSAMGEVCTCALPTGSSCRGCAQIARSLLVYGTIPVRNAAARLRCRRRPSESRIRRTLTACRNLARRWWPSTSVAGTESRPSRFDIVVQGPRQSVHNAYSGACRIFCLSYLKV